MSQEIVGLRNSEDLRLPGMHVELFHKHLAEVQEGNGASTAETRKLQTHMMFTLLLHRATSSSPSAASLCAKLYTQDTTGNLVIVEVRTPPHIRTLLHAK